MSGHNTNTLAAAAINTLLQDGLGEGLLRIAEMRLERTSHTDAEAYERNETCNGHADGFKPRSFQTAVGKLNLAVPQVRRSSGPFRTSLLESGSRTERSLKAAIAEMYLHGVSTHRVTKVLEELCGLQINSTQVSSAHRPSRYGVPTLANPATARDRAPRAPQPRNQGPHPCSRPLPRRILHFPLGHRHPQGNLGEAGIWTLLLLFPNSTLTFTNQPHLSFSLIRFYRKKLRRRFAPDQGRVSNGNDWKQSYNVVTSWICRFQSNFCNGSD